MKNLFLLLCAIAANIGFLMILLGIHGAGITLILWGGVAFLMIIGLSRYNAASRVRRSR